MIPDQPKINVLIVDDEKEARDNLKHMLEEYVDDQINVLGAAHNTREAEKQISKYNPDALFLDIEMPNENAFQFLERIGTFDFEVIFVTAYDEYAIRAFKLNAIDYILKPISISELTNAVAKLKEKLQYKKLLHTPSPYSDIYNQVNNKTKSQKITLKYGNEIEVVDFKHIYFLEAQGSYSKILFSKDNSVKEVIMSVSLTEYEELLPSELFYRIHKSYLINCSHVNKILKDEYNHVVLNDTYTLPVSRRKFTTLIEFLKSNDYYNE